MPALELLDLSNNKIEIVPRGLFPCLAKLKRLDLSHNALRALPGDIGELRCTRACTRTRTAHVPVPPHSAAQAAHGLGCVHRGRRRQGLACPCHQPPLGSERGRPP